MDSVPRSRWVCFSCVSIDISFLGRLRLFIYGWAKAHPHAVFEMLRSCTYVDQTRLLHAKSSPDPFINRSELRCVKEALGYWSAM